jgi:hypothetical protein
LKEFLKITVFSLFTLMRNCVEKTWTEKLNKVTAAVVVVVVVAVVLL